MSAPERVYIKMGGDERDLVRAAKKSDEALAQMVTRAEQVTKTTVEGAARERQAREQLLHGYRAQAQAAERGSAQQAAALQLVQREERKLGVETAENTRRMNLFGHSIDRSARGAIAGSGAFRSMGRSLVFASTAFLGAAGFTTVIRQSITAASDLHEQVNKSNVVFRDNAGVIRAWAKTTATSLGLADAEAIKFAGTFGNMLIPMGIAPRRAATMSVALVKLAADMASFNNIPVDVALEKIQSGLAGMPRPLREVGVFLDQTRIKAEALTSGLVKGNVDLGKVRDAETQVAIATANLAEAQKKYGEGSTQVASATVTLHKAQGALKDAVGGTIPPLTTAQKTMAAYQIIMKDTAIQHGDFARTSDGLANRLRILHAQVQELEASLGEALMPTVLEVIGGMTDWLGQTENQERVTKDLHLAVDAVTTTLDGLVGVVRTVDKVTGGFKQTMELLIGLSVASKLLKWAAAFDVLGASAGGGVGATGKVTRLHGALRGLAAMGAVTILIEVLLNKKAIDNIGNQLDGILNDAFSHIPGFKGSWLHGKLTDTGVFGNTGTAAQRPGAGAQSAQQGMPAQKASRAQQSLVATAEKVGVGSGITYVWGGASPQSGFDCSGYLQWVYAQHGIKIPHNTVAQFNDPNAIIVPSGQEQPGDGVYFETSGPGARPQHVGFYLGGGRFIEYFSKGKPAKYNTIAAKGGYMGARRWLKVQATTGGGDTGGTGAGAGAGAGTGLHVGATPKKATGVALVPLALTEGLERAKLTRTLDDDLAALEKINTYLTKRVKGEKDRKKRIELLKELVSVRGQIAGLHKRIKPAPTAAAVGDELSQLTGYISGLPDDLRADLAPKLAAVGKLFEKMVTAENRRNVMKELGKLKTEVIKQLQTFEDAAWASIRDTILKAYDEQVVNRVANNRAFISTQLTQAQAAKKADRARGQIATAGAAGLTPAMQTIKEKGDAVLDAWENVFAATAGSVASNTDEMQRAAGKLAEAQNQFEGISGDLTDAEQAYLAAYQALIEAKQTLGEGILDKWQKTTEQQAQLKRKSVEKQLTKVYADLRAGKITVTQAQQQLSDILASVGLTLADLGDALDNTDLQNALADLTSAIQSLTQLLGGGGGPSGPDPRATPAPGRPGGVQAPEVYPSQLVGGGGAQVAPIIVNVYASAGEVRMDGAPVGVITAPTVVTEIAKLGSVNGGTVPGWRGVVTP
jgi:cell wall-associated NlpC family hydrolase